MAGSFKMCLLSITFILLSCVGVVKMLRGDGGVEAAKIDCPPVLE
jgi:hypothetical protein